MNKKNYLKCSFGFYLLVSHLLIIVIFAYWVFVLPDWYLDSRGCALSKLDCSPQARDLLEEHFKKIYHGSK